MITAGVLSLVILAGAGALWGLTDYALGRINRVDAFKGLLHRPEGGSGGAMNVLLVGSDRREGLTNEQIRQLHLGHDAGQRSDTMFLAHISEHRDKATLISLPRDWYVRIPAHTSSSGGRVPASMGKLNWAYSFGGPNLTVATVEQATGVRIDHYVEINFLGFVNMVDALGGVDVCLPRAVNDDAYTGLHLSAGRHHVDGIHGLEYVRLRHGLGDGSDLGRIQREQQFLGSMMRQATSTGTLLNPVKFSHFLGAALDAVRADPGLSAGDMKALATKLRHMDPQHVTFATVPLADADYRGDPHVGSSVLVDRAAAARLFGRIKHDQPITGPVKGTKGKGGDGGATHLTVPASRIAVKVYNGTTVPGLGSRVAHDLSGVGFIVPEPAANAPNTRNATQTLVQYGPSRADSARTLQAAIPGSRLQQVPGLGDGIQVVAGSSYRGVRQVQVSAAQAAAGSSSSRDTVKTRTAAENPCT